MTRLCERTFKERSNKGACCRLTGLSQPGMERANPTKRASGEGVLLCRYLADRASAQAGVEVQLPGHMSTKGLLSIRRADCIHARTKCASTKNMGKNVKKATR